ncbi:hypothetical protein FVE85_5340 [Porphyridium purpureum]|uniref:Uncharacterized protein n=1 Tax=Porphyridium purpureum TaxID=35688 RepID=A0A5J4Z387_PORPP|nr:hypothetical protein FVE85_5340 [Porphyridium purpureum]|eukprot:POR3507..scf295_1
MIMETVLGAEVGMDERCVNCGRVVWVEQQLSASDSAPLVDEKGGRYCGQNCRWSVMLGGGRRPAAGVRRKLRVAKQEANSPAPEHEHHLESSLRADPPHVMLHAEAALKARPDVMAGLRASGTARSEALPVVVEDRENENAMFEYHNMNNFHRGSFF